MRSKPNDTAEPVRARLLKASLECFLSDEYHKVSTRLIAEKAETNVAMIRYYFGNKEGLYEEMIKEKLGALLDALDGQINTSNDPDIVRMAFVSLAMTPMLLKDIFEEQMGYEMDDAFIDKFATFNGHLFSAGLAPTKI